MDLLRRLLAKPEKTFQGFGVQSKLITLVLAASLVSLLLTGSLSFALARHLLAEAGYERLTALRNARAEAIRQYIEDLSNNVMTLSETRMTIDGMQRFTQAFNTLPDINEAQQQQLRTYYEKLFIPKLAKNIVGEPSAATYYPASSAERFVKFHYFMANPNFGSRDSGSSSAADGSSLNDAGDGSSWSAIHKEYHRRFRRLADLFDYQDILMVDINTGNVVYSVRKEDDLGTNLLSGPYADSSLASVFRQVRKSHDPLFVAYSDFENYKPSFGMSTMFIGTTVFSGNKLIGVLIFQVKNTRVDNLMTSSRRWAEVGMGKTGETYLVARDSTFRSSPRGFLEDPGRYLKTAQKHGLSQARVDAIQKTGTPILIQPVKTIGAANALAGKTGTSSYLDYRSVPVVSSYQPVRFGGFNWGLLSEIDQSELFGGISRLARSLLTMAALLIPAITLITLWMARSFIRPIRRMLDATETIGAGDYQVRVPVLADDEFGDLAAAFNAMSDKLAEREDALKEQVEENQRLLLSILPSSAASRLQRGGTAIAETHPSVTVLFAEIEGWNEISHSLPAETSITLLNELTSALDSTVEEFDVEKLQDVGTSYLAVSGLSKPRIDHEKRAVDCALALLQVVRRFNINHSVELSLDIGIHAGPLTTGVVQGEHLSFDVWGRTINIARGIHESPKRNVIQVSTPIVEALHGMYTFIPLPSIAVKGEGSLPIWEVEGPLLNREQASPSQPEEAVS